MNNSDKTSGITRRDFLKTMAVGTVAVSTMGIMAGCSTPAAGDTAPDNATKGGHVGETYGNLNTATQGETKAYTKYDAFAVVADEEGYPIAAKLFRATADAERIHAGLEKNLAYTMDVSRNEPSTDIDAPGTTAENLQTAIDGETYEFTEMYPPMIESANAEGLTVIADVFRRAMKAEEGHARTYQDMLDNLETMEETDYYLCPTCGYVHKGAGATVCPVCGVAGVMFKQY